MRRTSFLLAAGALLVPAANPFAAGAPNAPLNAGAGEVEACPKAGAGAAFGCPNAKGAGEVAIPSPEDDCAPNIAGCNKNMESHTVHDSYDLPGNWR